MIEMTTQLGDTAVHIIAPGVGELDPERWDGFFGRETYGFDVETRAIEKSGRGIWYPDFKIRLVQLAALRPDGAVEAWVLRMDDPEQEDAARELLEHEATGLITHTAYDALATWRHFGVDVADRVLDTYVLARLAMKRDSKAHETLGLKALVEQHLSAELPDAAAALKEEFKRLAAAAGISAPAEAVSAYGWNHIPLDHPIYVEYAALDAAAEVLLAPILIKEGGQPDHTLSAEQRLAALCARQSIQGLRLDLPRLEKTEADLRSKLDPLAAEHIELSGMTITQTAATLAPWLEERGFDPEQAPKTKSGGACLDKKAVPYLLATQGESLTSEARRILEIRAEATALKADLGVIRQWRAACDEDGVIHPQILSMGTSTGRVATRQPNVQNIHARLRGLIIPREGWGFAAIDLDQVELRFAHAYAGQTEVVETVLAGGDLHQLTADRTGVSRKVAKTLNFAVLYGSGAGGVSELAGISEREAKAAVTAFWRGYPKLSRFRDRISGRERTRVELASGRLVPAPWGARFNRLGEKLEGTGEAKGFARLNYAVQGSCRDLLMGAWLRLEDEHGFGEYVTLTIHDEMLLSAPVELLPEVMAAAKKCLSFTYLHGMPINADPDELLDENGEYRWMKGEEAQAIAARGLAENLPTS